MNDAYTIRIYNEIEEDFDTDLLDSNGNKLVFESESNARHFINKNKIDHGYKIAYIFKNNKLISE